MNTDKWINTINQVTAGFQSTFGHLTPEQLNKKPDAKTWSVAQNMDHLIVINETYYPVLKSLHDGTYKTPFMGKMGFMVRYLGKTILKAVQPDRKKKMKTFPIWEPSQSNISADILQRFAQHQEELKKMIADAKPLLEKGAVLSSPSNKNIVYTLETAFDIIVTHEERHLVQAKELLPILNGK